MSKRSKSRKQRKKSEQGRKETRSSHPSGGGWDTLETAFGAFLGSTPPAAPPGHGGPPSIAPGSPPPPLPMAARPVVSRKPAQKPTPKPFQKPAQKSDQKPPHKPVQRAIHKPAPESSQKPALRQARSRPAPATPARELMRVDPAQKREPSAAPPTPPPMPTAAEGGKLTLTQIYETLAALLVPYARKMESEMHPKIGFCLKAKSARTGRETHFGAVQAVPDGVVYHLFPLYGHPDLLEKVTPELFNRMRSKTCFHFEELHAGLVEELARLTHAGFERFLADGVLQ